MAQQKGKKKNTSKKTNTNVKKTKSRATNKDFVINKQLMAVILFAVSILWFCLSVIYAVSYSLWTILLKHNPASRVTIHSFMTPVFGVLTSAFLLSEDGGVAPFNLILALFLVCFGIVLWGYEKKNS